MTILFSSPRAKTVSAKNGAPGVSLEQAADAMQHLDAGNTRGKIAIRVADD